MTGLSAGTDNSILVLNSSNQLVTDEIDSRVWGSTLVDGSGTAGYPTYWSDENTLTSEPYLSVARGGTGVGTLTDGYVLLGSGTDDITPLNVTADGTILIGDGSGDPTTLAAFTTSTGTLKHEYGGLEADVSSYAGLVSITGGATAEVDSLSELSALLLGETIASTTHLWTDEYISNTLTVDGYMQDTDINTLAKLNAWLPGETIASTTHLWDVACGGTGLISVTDGYFLIGNSGSALEATSSIFMDSLGNIGIGTTTTAAQLAIQSTGTQLMLAYDSDSYVTLSTNSEGTLEISGSSAVGGDVYIGDVGSASNLVFEEDSAILGQGTNTITLGESGDTFNLNTSGTTYNIQIWDDTPMKFGDSDDASIEWNTAPTTDALTFTGFTRFATTTNSVINPTSIGNPSSGDVFVQDDLEVGGTVYLGATYMSGNVGIGDTSPDYAFTVDHNGDGTNVAYVNDSNAWTNGSADYAEFFYTIDTDLEAGEAVCIDIEREDAIKRCVRGADTNIIGIISTSPAILANAPVEERRENNPHYAIVGMLGQVPAKVSTENGDIRPGDSLTSALIPGYIMKANAGDPTVGVALEELRTEGEESITGIINVLISRRNKSITVEEVEEKVTDRIANMEIEDEVNILIANAIDTLNLDDEINETIDPKLLLLATQLTVQTDDLSDRIINVETNVADIAGVLNQIQNDMVILRSDIAKISDLENAWILDDEGSVKLANDNSTSAVAIVEINTASTTAKTAFVVNQIGTGDVADFQYDQVSVMNINNQGRVSVVGELLVDGRIMACAGGSCGEALETAVDETMGDIGVEGKVVAGAFEGYCEDGYVWVPGSAKYGTMPGFCVMTDLINEDGQTVDEFSNRWVNISQGEAQLACQSLGIDYHLISENEWLTIAENIMRVAENDIDVDVDGMQLATTSAEFVLTNGNIIYEFINGVSEWTDQIVTSAGVMLPASNSWQEYYEITDYKGFNIAPAYYYDSSNGIGMIKTGGNSSLRCFVRGETGIYGLDLSHAPNEENENIGFRCAK